MFDDPDFQEELFKTSDFGTRIRSNWAMRMYELVSYLLAEQYIEDYAGELNLMLDEYEENIR